MGPLLAMMIWSYPLDNYAQRPSYKEFGQYITADFYKGKENIFPNKFTGYHAGKDVEILPGEKNKDVPVYAIGNGKISLLGLVSGYGGLILEKLDNTNNTALYGHIKLAGANVKNGDAVTAGEKLTVLGQGFSGETDGERKHLHFGIYTGSDLYFKGYEQTTTVLAKRWLDPTAFLQTRIPTSTPTVIPIQKQNGISLPAESWFDVFLKKAQIFLSRIW